MTGAERERKRGTTRGNRRGGGSTLHSLIPLIYRSIDRGLFGFAHRDHDPESSVRRLEKRRRVETTEEEEEEEEECCLSSAARSIAPLIPLIPLIGGGKKQEVC